MHEEHADLIRRRWRREGGKTQVSMPAASHSMHRYVERHTMSVTRRRTQHSWPRSVHRRQEMVVVGGVILWEYHTIGEDNWMMMMV